MSNKNHSSIEKLINSASYYEAFQLIKFQYHRYTLKKKFNEACSLCIEYAEKLADEKEYDISVELAILYIKTIIANAISITKERINNIIRVFNKYPSFKAKHKYRFINTALGWVKNIGNKEVEKELHLCVANAYINERNFGSAQGHLVFCHDGCKLANMIKEWQNDCYPSEKHLLSFRVVLILLYLDDLSAAEEFLNELHFDFDSIDVHPCIQFGYLLVMACKYKNKKFYETIKKKYNLIIRKDTSFDTYITEIDKKYFGLGRGSAVNIFSFLNNLLPTGSNTAERPLSTTAV